MKISRRNIEIIQAEQGLTQAAIAERAGISKQSVYVLMSSGSCNPVTAGKLAAALGVPVEKILAE